MYARRKQLNINNMRYYLTLLLILLCSSSAWAANITIDPCTPNGEQFLTDITFDELHETISFYDHFKPGEEVGRIYEYFVYFKNEKTGFYMQTYRNQFFHPMKQIIDYGYVDNGKFTQSLSSSSKESFVRRAAQKGKEAQGVPVTISVKGMKKNLAYYGCKSAIIFVRGYEYDPWTCEVLPPDDGPNESPTNNWMSQNVEVNFDFVSVTLVECDDAVELSGPNFTPKLKYKVYFFYNEKYSMLNPPYLDATIYALYGDDFHVTSSRTKVSHETDCVGTLELKDRFSQMHIGNFENAVFYVDVKLKEYGKDDVVKSTVTGEVVMPYKYPVKVGKHVGDWDKVEYYQTGENVKFEVGSSACREINGYEFKHEGDYAIFKMPRNEVCFITRDDYYHVEFIDCDGTTLSTVEVLRGYPVSRFCEIPVPPSHAGMEFVGWDKPLDNVQENMRVRAQYKIDPKYGRFESNVIHTSQYPKFKNNETQAFFGDRLTFSMDVQAPASVHVDLQYRANDGEWLTTASRTLTDKEAQEGVTIVETRRLDDAVAYRRSRYAYRFQVWSYTYGLSVYSPIYTYDMYYPLTVESSTDDLRLYNEDNELISYLPHGAVDATFAVRYGKKLRIESLTGDPDCLEFAFVNNTTPLHEGVHYGSEYGMRWVEMPGQPETLKVTRPTRQVVYEVIGCGNPKGYGNNVWDKKTVPCGAPVDLPVQPEEPTDSWNYYFSYWLDQNTGKVIDPHGIHEDTYVVAVFEEYPEQVLHTVTFLDWDGTVLKTAYTANEGSATPPSNPTRDGYYFAGWDVNPCNITRDTVIKAVYKELKSSAGDVNGDGTVSIKDVVAVLEAMASDSKDLKYDVNDDGSVSIKDVVAVLEIMAGQ